MSSTGAAESSSSDSRGSSTGGICSWGSVELEFESTGVYVSQGDTWQSFTADTSGEIVQIDFFWNLSGVNDEFVINLDEGEGTGGALLHSEQFPGQGMGTFVGFDVNRLSEPVPLTAGQVYTVEGVDTFGWQAASGMIVGGTSGLGPDLHKNIRVWVVPCT